MSNFECLFRTSISQETPDGLTKFISVDRRVPDGLAFLQIRYFRRIGNNYKATPVGISLSQQQVKEFIELAKNVLVVSEPFLGSPFLTPAGLFSLSVSFADCAENCWLMVTKDGKQVIISRRKEDESVKGIKLSFKEFLVFKRYFDAISLLLFPQTCPKNVEIIQPLAFEISKLIQGLVFDACTGCQMDLANQLGHNCLNPHSQTNAELHLEEAIKRLDITRCAGNIKFLHHAFKRENELPTEDSLKEYLEDPSWYLDVQKLDPNPYFTILSSFLELCEHE